jgi:2-dehydropantoate 2-reductase
MDIVLIFRINEEVPMKTIGYIGFGAIGATIGARMIDKGMPIKVIVDPSRRQRYETEGVVVNQKTYHFDVLTPDVAHAPLDVIMVSVKYNQLPEAAEIIKPFVNADTTIVSLLNGIDSEEILAKTFDKAQIIHAFVVAIDALRIGNAINYTNNGKIIFGAGYPEASARLAAVSEVLAKGDIAYEIKDEIIKELWWKFLVNVGINQVSAVLRGPYGLFQTNPYAQTLMHQTMQEVIDVAAATGVVLGDQAIGTFMTILDTLGKENKTSMLQDVDAKRITEVDMLAGKMIALGKAYDIPVPMNEVLFKMIKAIEANYENL